MSALTSLNPRVPLTTRPRRDGETDGIHYHFVSKDEFQRLLDADAFVEHGEYKGNFYGTLKRSVSSYSQPSRALSVAYKARSNNLHKLQTVILHRAENDSFNVAITGGARSKRLICVNEVLPQAVQVAYTLRPLREGDCIIAVDGVSVGGVPLEDAQALLREAGPTTELLVFNMDGKVDADLTLLSNFLQEDPSDSEELANVKADIRADVYGRTVPYTTRAPREGEVDGEDYHFVSEETFKQMLKDDKFVEHGEANGVMYGTPKPTPGAPLRTPSSRKDRQQQQLEGVSSSATSGANGRPSFRRSRAHAASVRATSKPRSLVIKHKGPYSGIGLELTQTAAGVFVLDVEEGSPAAKAGLSKAMQILAVDGMDVDDKGVSFVRQRLGQVADEHEVVVRYNTRDFSSAAASLVSGAKKDHIFTAVLGRNSSDAWGISVGGGAEQGKLITFEAVEDVNYIAKTQDVKKGDCLLAVDGVSVAGSGLSHAVDLIRKADRDIELTVLSTADTAVTPSLDDFFFASKYDSQALAAAKADIRASVYDSTVPYTTRAPREGEVDGKDYHFVSEATFKDMINAGSFLEWGEKNGAYYGTPKAFSPRKSRRASRAHQSIRRTKDTVQTVVVGRLSNGTWGIELGGGLSQGVLPHVANVADDCRMIAFTQRRLLPGDVLLAVNGVSIVGNEIDYITNLMDNQGDEVELTILCVNTTRPTSFRTLLSSNTGALPKDVASVLEDVRSDVYKSTVPFTTRAPREGERDGVDYHFVTEEEFRRMESEGKFIEVGQSNGVLYGTASQAKSSFKPRSSRTRRRLSTRSRFSRPRVFVIHADDNESMGLSLSPIAPGSGGGIEVLSTESGQPAHTAGLRAGMKVLTVDGTPVDQKDVNDVAQMLLDPFKEKGSVTLTACYAPSTQMMAKVNVPVFEEPSALKESEEETHVHFVGLEHIQPGSVRIIQAWACPRSLSTALMYSFAQRADTAVRDEPFYGSFLHRHPELNHPMRDEIIASQHNDPAEVVQSILSHTSSRVLYCKNLVKHLPTNVDDAWLGQCVHVLQFRNPAAVLSSFREFAQPTAEETCFPQAYALMTRLRERNIPFCVVDSDALTANPEAVLRQLCARLGLEFDSAMLSWPEGPKEYDGVWAPVWYKTVHSTTGFVTNTSVATLEPSLVPTIKDVYPLYQAMAKRAIGAGVSPSKLARAAPESDNVNPAAIPDERNEDIMVWVGRGLVPRAFASMSVFDSTVQGGDAVWEGLRVYDGKAFRLDHHIQRLHDSARAMAFEDIPSADDIKLAVFRTLAANNMRDGVHVRITLSRGEKITSSMNPAFNRSGSVLVVLPEFKPVEGTATYNNVDGVSLITAATRRNSPQCLDSKIHHCNLANNILAKVQANAAGAADAIMLDVDGFVAETNATNLFAVKNGAVLTPTADACLPGITRAAVIELVNKLNIPLQERRVSLAEFHAADEVFTTGTMGELTPVVRIDGRTIGNGSRGPVTERIQTAFDEMTQGEGEKLPF